MVNYGNIILIENYLFMFLIKRSWLKIKELILKNRSPGEYCSNDCDKNFLVNSCPLLINRIKNEDISKPEKYICGKNYLQRYYLSIKNFKEEQKEGLQLFAKPKTDCLLKEKKFMANQKAEKTHSEVFRRYNSIENIMKYLSQEKYYCYNINFFKINQFVFLTEYFFVDLEYNLYLSLKIVKEDGCEKIMSFYVSDKENEFYKINGGV